MKTFSPKPQSVVREWHIIDASEYPLGRVSTKTASLLLGKHKPAQSPHVDGGDHVVIINSDNVRVTGNKEQDKLYRRHSGYPGGLREKSLKDIASQDSTRIIYKAVRGMLPDNKLRKGRLARLKIYAGSEHPHGGQLSGTKDINKESDN